MEKEKKNMYACLQNSSIDYCLQTSKHNKIISVIKQLIRIKPYIFIFYGTNISNQICEVTKFPHKNTFDETKIKKGKKERKNLMDESFVQRFTC